MPTPEKANSVRLVWPISAAPAARSRATAGQSAAAGAASAIDCDAAVLGMAGHVEQVLHRHRQPGQRRQRRAGGARRVHRRGRGARRGVEAAHEGVAAGRRVGRGDGALEGAAGAQPAGGHLGRGRVRSSAGVAC